MAAINTIGGILTVIPLGSIPVIGEKLTVFIAHYHAIINDVIHYVLSSFGQHGVELLKFVCGGTIKLLEDRGLTDDLIGILYKSGLPENIVDSLASNVAKAGGTFNYVIKTAEGITVYLTKYGIKTDVYYIDDGKSYIQNTLKIDLSQGITNEIKGDIGEAAAKRLAESKGYTVLGPADGFYKSSSLDQGLDLVCWDKQNKKYVIIEAKFTSTVNGDVTKDILSVTKKGYREMDDNWIPDAINRMLDNNKISKDLADKLLAQKPEDIEKELVVVENVPKNGATIDSSLADPTLRFQAVHIVKIDNVV